MKRQESQTLEFKEFMGGIEVTFVRKVFNDTINGTVNDKNDTISDTIKIENKNEEALYKLLQREPGLNAFEISKELGKSVRTIRRYITSLADKGLIEFKGAPKTGGYYLVRKKDNI